MNRSSIKEKIQMVKMNMKKCLMSLIIKEMQIKTTIRYHLIPQRLVFNNETTTTTTTTTNKDVEEEGISFTANRNVYWSSFFAR